MVQFLPQSEQIGSVASIPNDLAGGDLHTAILQDPLKIQAYRETIAKQMNDQSAGPTFTDLSERISGITIETSAQGASILTVTLIDPLWVLPMSGFIQVDQYGYLWPPIDINFPSGTDCVWRLCQYHAIWDADMSTPNLTLTFEDRIASLLREMDSSSNFGVAQGQANQTLGDFIKQLVDSANKSLRPNPKIRLIEMISPQDPNYTVQINDIPSSAQASLNHQPVRKDPLKLNSGPTAAQQAQLNNIQQTVATLFKTSPLLSPAPIGLTLQDIEQEAAKLMGSNPPETGGTTGPFGGDPFLGTPVSGN
jgi:hypothetical protein